MKPTSDWEYIYIYASTNIDQKHRRREILTLNGAEPTRMRRLVPNIYQKETHYVKIA